MRVLLVHNRYRDRFVSGENRMVELEVELLRNGGHDVVTYIRQSDEIAEFRTRERLRLPARVVWSTEDRRDLTRTASRMRPDVVHVHNTFPLISPSVISAIADLNIPLVTTLHNFRLICANGLLLRNGRPCEACLHSSPIQGLLYGCYRGSRLSTAPITLNIAIHRWLQTWSRVSAFVALSEFARGKMVQGGFPEDRVVVKPNFTPDPGRQRLGAGEHFLFLGRLTREKGVDLLVSAWSARLGTLLVAGDGPALQDLSETAGGDGTVRFLGQRSTEECGDLLRSARALVVPSRAYEGFPVAVVEAFAHGVPVIGPAHGAFPEIIDHGKTGFLFRPGDREDLLRRIQELHTPDRSVEMGEAARRAYEANYTPERNLKILEGIYEQVCGMERSDRTRSSPKLVDTGPLRVT